MSARAGGERSAERAQYADAHIGRGAEDALVHGRGLGDGHGQPGAGLPVVGRVSYQQVPLAVRLRVLQPAWLARAQGVECRDPAQRRDVVPRGGQRVVDARVPDQLQSSGGQARVDHDRVGLHLRCQLLPQALGELLRGGDVDECPAQGGECGGTLVVGAGVARGRDGGLGGGLRIRLGDTGRRRQTAERDPALLQERATAGLGAPPQVLLGRVRGTARQRHHRAPGTLQDGRHRRQVPQPVHLGTLPGDDLGQRDRVRCGTGLRRRGGLTRHATSIAHKPRFDRGLARAGFTRKRTAGRLERTHRHAHGDQSSRGRYSHNRNSRLSSGMTR